MPLSLEHFHLVPFPLYSLIISPSSHARGIFSASCAFSVMAFNIFLVSGVPSMNISFGILSGPRLFFLFSFLLRCWIPLCLFHCSPLHSAGVLAPGALYPFPDPPTSVEKVPFKWGLCLDVPPWNSLQDIWVRLVKWRKLMRRRRCHVTVKCRRISIPTSTQILKNGYIEDCYEKNSSKFSVNVVFITWPTICIICFLSEPLDVEIWPFKPWELTGVVCPGLALGQQNLWADDDRSSQAHTVSLSPVPVQFRCLSLDMAVLCSSRGIGSSAHFVDNISALPPAKQVQAQPDCGPGPEIGTG